MKKVLMIFVLVLAILPGMIYAASTEDNQAEFLQSLFQEYFPDYSCEDGHLQYDETAVFIGRKTDGTLVLLCGSDEGEDGWEWVESTPLPEGTRIGDENITDAVNMNAWRGGAAVGVRRMERGRWGIYYVNSYDFFIGPDWVGMYGAETNAQFFGTHSWGDITTIDWSTLPPEEHIGRETKEERDNRISAYVDRTNWATPAHSDPEATTELLSEKGNEDSLLGRFYDGTPLFVLEQGEEWTKVKIGHGEDSGVMTGWMRTADLAFGDNTMHVDREKVRISSEQVLIHTDEPFIGSRTGQITKGQFSDCLVIGETETDLSYAIVYYLPYGDVGLIPMTSLGNGNGSVETLISSVIQSSYPGCQLFDYAPIGQEKTAYIVLAVDAGEKPAVMIVNTEQPSAGEEFCNDRILEGIPPDRNHLQIMDHLADGNPYLWYTNPEGPDLLYIVFRKNDDGQWLVHEAQFGDDWCDLYWFQYSDEDRQLHFFLSGNDLTATSDDVIDHNAESFYPTYVRQYMRDMLEPYLR